MIQAVSNMETHLGICELVQLVALQSQATLSLAKGLPDLICALHSACLMWIIPAEDDKCCLYRLVTACHCKSTHVDNIEFVAVISSEQNWPAAQDKWQAILFLRIAMQSACCVDNEHWTAQLTEGRSVALRRGLCL